ncbi:hypothetical protein [Bacillus marinisedimentorum]|uniref:hypothetical protein n=1 Tax=Bacillus marinisedimentorum TaxID=1821260 RepID=UPI00087296C6|nr:hypothetical protein [Bacillus marinisedimentorum]
MKPVLFLTTYNLVIIVSSILYISFGVEVRKTASFLDSVILVGVVYIFGWAILGLLFRFKFIKKQVTQRDVWISMIPNGVITLFLIVTGMMSHLGFISFFISQVVFISIMVIPFLFFGLARIKIHN